MPRPSYLGHSSIVFSILICMTRVLITICHTYLQGVLALSGMNIPGKTPEDARHDVLFVSCNDDTVHLYELPL